MSSGSLQTYEEYRSQEEQSEGKRAGNSGLLEYATLVREEL